jgi:hypothetical protein
LPNAEWARPWTAGRRCQGATPDAAALGDHLATVLGRLRGGDVVVVYFIGLGPLMKATGFSEHRRRPRTLAWFGTSRKPEHDDLWSV